MKKHLTLIAAVAAAAMILAGCSKAPADFDVATLGHDLADRIAYQDELMELDLDTAQMFLALSGIGVEKAAIYEGSGGTAEEIVVLECATEDDAKKAGEALKTRVAEQTESFKDYVPEELTKLGDAVIVVSGRYAVLSVSDTPDDAKKIIDGYMK